MNREDVWQNNTYWEENGKYQSLSNSIQELIPDNGEAATDKLNLFRVASNAYYDMYNNGGWNSGRFESLWNYVPKFADELIRHGLSSEDLKMLERVCSDGFDDNDFGLRDFCFDIVQDKAVFELFERLADAVVLIAQSELPQTANS